MGKNVLEVASTEDLGPAMQALNPRQRKFVTAIVCFGGTHADAYGYAGYETTNRDSTLAASARLANHPKIQAAIQEELPRRLKAGAPLALQVVLDMATGQMNVDHKTRLSAANSYLDRAGVTAKSEIMHHHRVETEDMDELMAYIRGSAARIANVDPEKLLESAVVDAEFEEVPIGQPSVDKTSEEETGLEDLL